MDSMVAEIRRERASRLLVPLFFVSGATGLTYQTVWGRELHLIFGTSTLAIATVLAAFMAGLGLGGAWMARRVDTIERPLRMYGLLEVGIGLYAVVFPWLLAGITPIYLAAGRAGWPPAAVHALQFVLVGAAVVLPTAWMGATLPLLARFATERLADAGDRVGVLYATNTAGAVAGTWLCGFVLLPGLGLHTTTVLAASANVVLGLIALWLDSTTDVLRSDATTDDAPELPRTPVVRAVLISAAIAGFCGLVYEVAWFRLLGLMLGASTYAFSLMLLAFLIGIAIGGRLGGPWADRLLARSGVRGVVVALAGVQVAVGATSLLMMHAFRELPFWYVWLFDSVGADRAPELVWMVSLLLAGLVMTPAAVWMGAAFPLAVRAAIGGSEALGGAVGRVYAVNTAGGVLGAALAGFVLLPMLYVEGTLVLAASLNVLAGAVVWMARRHAEGGTANEPSWMAWGVPGGVAAGAALMAVLWPGWDPLMMTAGMYKYVTDFDDHSREGIESYAKGQYELLYYREGLSSVVTVASNVDSGNIWLANNGKVDASTTVDMPTQVMVSLLPMQFVDSPDDVLVIGLASGITAGAVSLVDDVKRLEVVELEPAIVAAARFFDEHNHHVLDDPRTELILDDGRNHVLRAAPGSYDVVVSEPSNPWITGVSNLFTREFFELGKSRLKPGGVWGQWVQMYGMDDEDLRSLLATFADVYPHVLLYAAAEDADLVLVGSDRELIPTREAARSLHRWPRAKAELEVVSLVDPVDLMATWITDRDGILEMVGTVERNTDDNMRIEYRAPLHLHEDTQSRNVPMLYRAADMPWWAFRGDRDGVEALARAYYAREDMGRAVVAMTAAIKLMPVEDPRRPGLQAELEQWFDEGS